MAASGEKPYRVYRGGRTKGKVPLAGARRATARAAQRTTYRGGGGGGDGRQVVRRQRRRWTWKRWTWRHARSRSSSCSSSGASPATSRCAAASRPRTSACPRATTAALQAAERAAALERARTSCCSAPTTRRTARPGRSSDQHSDSMMLLRTDPSRHRLVYPLDPARPARVDPRLRRAKINAAMQIGGPKLAITDGDAALRTGPAGQPRRVVDFGAFKTLIDARRRHRHQRAASRSSRTASTAPTRRSTRCEQWQGWRFQQGRAAHERAPRAHLLAHPREPAQPGRHATSARGAAPAGR